MLSKYKKEDNENHVKIFNKWVYRKPLPLDTQMSDLYKPDAPKLLDIRDHIQRVVIWTGPAYEPWDRQKVDEGMAGSETWASYIAREFVKRGYRTYVYNDLRAASKDDTVLDPVHDKMGNLIDHVIYRDHTKLQEDIKYDIVHYFISSRSVDPLRLNLHSLKNYVMIHDVWISADKNYDIMPWRVEKYGYLSDWHGDFLLSHHKTMPKDKMFLTANGLTPPDAWDDVDSYKKKNQSVYSSSPDRGLYQLLQMVPDIRKEVPDFELVVCYGFYNWEKFVESRKDEQGKKFLEEVKRLMDQPGVKYVGRVPKVELARYQKESKVWLYPSWFAETFCCHPENYILTADGPKRIIDLTIEDKVITHENRYRRIEKILSREYDGDLINLNLANHKNVGGYFTPEHPVLMLKGDNVRKVKKNRKLRKKSGRLDYSYDNECKMDKDPEWCSIKDVKIGDYVCTPYYGESIPEKYYEPLEDMLIINRNYKVVRGKIVGKDRGNDKGLPVRIKMDTNFGRFLGFYMSEGGFSQSTVKFSFHKDEKDYINFVRNYIQETFRYEVKVEEKGNYVEVISYFNTLGVLLKELFGRECSKKKVPYFIYNQDSSFIKSFIKGTLEGDRYFGGNERKIELSSKKAIIGLKILLNKIGLHPNYGRIAKKGRIYYKLGLSTSLWEEIFNENFDHKKKTYRVYFEKNGKLFFKVKEINKKSYKGRVYNLEVQEDNSYTSDFIAVHNCISGLEAGFAKNAVVSTDFAGLKTVIGSAGILLPADGLYREASYPFYYTNKFKEEAIKLLTDENYRLSWAQKAYEKVQEYTWDKIAGKWIKIFDE